MVEPIKVLIADDQTLFRSGLARMLAADSRVKVVGVARDGQEAVDQALAQGPNVVLMDLQMPRVNGVEATQRLMREAPGIHVLALSAYADEAMIREALDSGAEAVVDKDVTLEEMIARILDVVQPARTSRRRGYAVPTQREVHVLRLVAEGMSNKQVARRLGISEKTVRNHLSRAFSKLGATNRTEAVMHAVRRGLVTA